MAAKSKAGRRRTVTSAAAVWACSSTVSCAAFIPLARVAPVASPRHNAQTAWPSHSLLSGAGEPDAPHTAITIAPQSQVEEKAYPRTAICIGSSIALLVFATLPTLIPHTIYMVTSNLLYLFRRAKLRRTTPFDILRIRMTHEDGVSPRLFALYILAWQLLVVVFPLAECAARLCGHASFFYSYPNARGGGYILEPLAVQHLPGNKRAKEQIRLDWHRFSYNVGSVGRDGYRHPPTVQKNLPHCDFPRKKLRHWPWRRRLTAAQKK